jgi:signal transduction histidine kinase
MLSGQYALISILVSIIYIVLEFLWEEQSVQTITIFSATIILLCTSIYMHRKGEHCTANYFLFPTLSVTISLLANSESYASGALAFYIPIMIGSFAVFDYKQRLWSIFFTAFTYVMFTLSYLRVIDVLPMRHYTNDELMLSLFINFSIAFYASIVTVIILIRLNYNNSIQLVESNKLLKKTNEELDRFVYSTSHDLRAPLASVIGLLGLSSQTTSPLEKARYERLMLKRIKDLDKFINDITDYSRNNRVGIRRSNVNLKNLSFEIWESLKHSHGAERIEFKTSFENDATVWTDATRLKIVLTNLISNAVRYHDSQKEMQFINLGYQVVNDTFILQIEDNGMGIAEEYQKRIFEMFFRANETSNGSGLGLYIVKETIDKLSGTIEVQSSTNVGSIFTVRLPSA